MRKRKNNFLGIFLLPMLVFRFFYFPKTSSQFKNDDSAFGYRGMFEFTENTRNN